MASDWFDGETFEHDHDGPRLRRQLTRVYALMFDSRWRTLDEISEVTGDPPASISARLRDLRKARFGAHDVARRRRGEYAAGLFEYRIVPPPPPPPIPAANLRQGALF
jgi:hypothetical protein